MFKNTIQIISMLLIILALVSCSSGCAIIGDTYNSLMEENIKPTCNNQYETFDDYINGC